MMKIKHGENYSIELYEEPPACTIQNTNGRETLIFTGADLIKAIVSVGMPDVYLTNTEKRNRKAEIEFKINIFETFVTSSEQGKLSFDTTRKIYLDSTEIGAINYWIGMVIVTVLGQKKFHYDFMVHLSKIELFSSKISIVKRPLFSAKGKITFKSPDLLAINCSKNTYGVFEAKGYSSYSTKTMNQGYIQARSIGMINGKKPTDCLVVMVLTGGKEIRARMRDPEGENCEITVDLDFLYLYHLLPIVELITELNPEKCGDRICGSLKYGDECYSISIPQDLHKEFAQIVKSDKESLLDEPVFESILSEKNLACLMSENLEKSEKRILCVE